MPNYDVAVVGAGMAGLSAAALLAAQGRKVFLADPAASAGGAVAEVERGGFRFSACPVAAYGFERQGILSVVTGSAGIPPLRASQPARYQVVLPGCRVTVSPEREETLDELRREFPRQMDSIGLLYRTAEQVLRKSSSSRFEAFVASHRSSSSFLRTYRFPQELTAFYEVQARYFFGRGFDALPLSDLAQMLCTPPAALSGYAPFAARLAARVQELGGAVRMNEPWPEILVTGRRLSGIRTSQGVVSAGKILVNADPGLPAGERTLFLGVRSVVIPVRMENTVLCVPDIRRPGDYCSLTVSPEGLGAPAGMRSIAATFPEDRNAPDEREQLRSQIREIMPFLDEFIENEAERDAAGRSMVLPDRVAPRRSDGSAPRQAPLRGGVRNLLFIPDATRSLLPSLQAAVRAAKELV